MSFTGLFPELSTGTSVNCPGVLGAWGPLKLSPHSFLAVATEPHFLAIFCYTIGQFFSLTKNADFSILYLLKNARPLFT